MNQRNHSRNFLFLVAAGLLIFTALFHSQRTAGAQTDLPATLDDTDSATAALFGPPLVAVSQQALDPTSLEQINEGVARGRIASVDFERLTGVQDAERVSAITVAAQIRLNLFADVDLLARRDALQQNPSGSYTWIGHIQGQPLSTVILVLQGERLYGTVQSPKLGEFAIQPFNAGNHLIQEAAPTTVLPEDDTHYGAEEAATTDTPNISEANPSQATTAETQQRLAAQAALAGSTADDGSLIDVLVVHSDDVSAVDAQSYAELFTAYTNLAYANSQIAQRIWLVDVEEFAYAETGDLSQDLDNITVNSMPNVAAHRNQHHADLVLFFVSNDGSGSSSCSGLAWLQTNVTLGFEDSGFAVMKACSFGSSIFAHELGHTMGARHDWFVDPGMTPFSYAHGYVDVINEFRTIMAYGNRCEALGINCLRIPQFSNPTVLYNGAPTGIAGGTATGCPFGNPNPVAECDADVRLTFANTALNTSLFRNSRLVWTGAINGDWHNAGNWEIAEGAPGATTPVNYIPRAIDNIFIPSGTATMPTISSGTANAREIVIADGATLAMSGGTLTVGLRWEDNGGFQGTGGTVILRGPLAMELAPGVGSTFANLQIGDGIGAALATLTGDLDINGNLTFKAGAQFRAGAQTIHLAGNWLDEGNGFAAESSTVIFDGTTQSIDKITTSTILSQDFSDYPGGNYTSAPPADWARSQSNGFGIAFGNEEARHWSDSTDAWLFTPALPLQPGILYTVRFDTYRSVGSTSSIALAYGAAQSAGAMGNSIGTLTNLPYFYQPQALAFAVATAGSYHIGFHSLQSVGNNRLDNIVIEGVQQPTFYDLQIGGNSHTTLNQDLGVTHDLQIGNGALLDLATHTVAVEGTVANNGSLRQRKEVPAGGTTAFLHMQNSAGTVDKYYGVDIIPSGSMGGTTVTIRGNQSCTEGDGGAGTVQRCYEIAPDTPQPAQIRFYYRSAEENNNPAPDLYHWSGSAWELETLESRGGSGNALWVTANNIDSYSPFRLDDQSAVATVTPTPTATDTPTPTATDTPTPTATDTPTPAATDTPTPTATDTPTPTATDMPTPTATDTPTPTAIDTPTPTVTPTTVPMGAPGDCNGDTSIDAGDLSATTLEIFDGDGAFWLDTAGGSFLGTPQCDANQDTLVNAGDLTCTVLLIFSGPGSCEGAGGN